LSWKHGFAKDLHLFIGVVHLAFLSVLTHTMLRGSSSNSPTQHLPFESISSLLLLISSTVILVGEQLTTKGALMIVIMLNTLNFTAKVTFK
jgi:hypothetical protein